MKYVKLGKTELNVSRLCFGGLIIGPLQKNMSPDAGSEVIAEALKRGVNFVDTAEIYGTYSHVREAIRKTGIKPIIATKSYAYSKEQAEKSFEKARKELDIDVIDIFLMHEQQNKMTIRGHREALEFYLNQKEKGKIKAVGASTHKIEAVYALAEMPEIDVIHPLINKAGIGIGDGTVDEMLAAIKKANENGKGIYSMKPLGGGNLISQYEESMKFILDIPYIHSVAVGMQSVEEVIMNIDVFENEQIEDGTTIALNMQKKKLHIDNWCGGCGKCVERCKQGALSIENNKAVVDHEKCLLCGYCSEVCPQFAIKIC